MVMKYLRIIGPKKPADDPAAEDRSGSSAAAPAELAATPAAQPAPPAEPAGPPAYRNRGADPGPTPTPGWGVYITHDPTQCRTPEDPEQARVLAAHSVAEVYDYVYAWADRSGQTLSEEQIQGMLPAAEAWLEARDQDYLAYLDELIDAAVETPPEATQ